MSNNQTPKTRVIAARPGAVSERVENNGQTFTRIIHNGMVIGQASTPNKAWAVADEYVKRQDALMVKPQAERHAQKTESKPSTTPEQRPVMVPAKVKQARRNKNRIARASRKRNRPNRAA